MPPIPPPAMRTFKRAIDASSRRLLKFSDPHCAFFSGFGKRSLAGNCDDSAGAVMESKPAKFGHHCDARHGRRATAMAMTLVQRRPLGALGGRHAKAIRDCHELSRVFGLSRQGR